MFNPVSNVAATRTPEQAAADQLKFDRRQALEHAVDLAKAGASRYGAKGYTSHTLLTYAEDITKYITDGTIPAETPTTATTMVAKLKETDPKGAPGPETREWLNEPNEATTTKRKGRAK